MIQITLQTPPFKGFPDGEYVDVVADEEDSAWIYVSRMYGVSVSELKVHKPAHKVTVRLVGHSRA